VVAEADGHNEGWRPRTFVDRVGSAIAAPRRALASSDVGDDPGRTGSDAATLIGLVFLVVATREIVASVWLMFAAGIGVGLQALISSLSHSITMELAFVVVSAIVLTLAAGRQRAIGRDFDLACVAFVPIVVVKLVATLVLRVTRHVPTHDVTTLISVVAYAWGGVVLFYAWRQARSRAAGGIALPPDDAAPARSRHAGRGLLIVASLILSFNSYWVARNYERLRPITPGDVAPQVALPAVDGQGRVTNQPVSLADLQGEVVLIDFWATWCGPCRKTLPGIERVYRDYKDQGFEVVAVNTDDPGKARTLFDERNLTFPLVVDDGIVSDRYGVSTIPHLVIVDRQGVVRYVHRGETSHATIEREVAKLVERPAP
jgi:peroxiredoxin